MAVISLWPQCKAGIEYSLPFAVRHFERRSLRQNALMTLHGKSARDRTRTCLLHLVLDK
jgi:hypothetical protein